MPRLSITLPKDLYDKVVAISGDNDESMSYTIAKMTELGLLVTENQKKNKAKTLSDIEEHCYKLTIQMNAIIKNIAAKQLDFKQHLPPTQSGQEIYCKNVGKFLLLISNKRKPSNKIR